MTNNRRWRGSLENLHSLKYLDPSSVEYPSPSQDAVETRLIEQYTNSQIRFRNYHMKRGYLLSKGPHNLC